ncbi:MAG: EpsI family protein [Armatimonadetes bacterium]|nr:EpsI family protein [Armatimonadota bacterium]
MSPSRRTAFILAGAFALTIVAARLIPAPDSVAPTPPAAPLPQKLGADFASGRVTDETTSATRAMLAAQTQIATRTYRDAHGQTLQVIRIIGSDRNALHDPRSCLAGVGWRIEDDRTETANGVSVRVCRLVGEGNRVPLLVAYGYVGENGAVIADPSAIRAKLLYQALVGGAAKSLIFLRLITPDTSGQPQAARGRLRSLAAGLIRAHATAPKP